MRSFTQSLQRKKAKNFKKCKRYKFSTNSLSFHQKKVCVRLGSHKISGRTGSLEIVTSLPDKIFCLGLSSHSWPSGKFVYARYARYTNSNALLWLRLSSIDVFCPHFVRAKNRPSGLERLSSPRQILL